MDNNCVFCLIDAGRIPSCRVYESPNVLAFLDVSPMEKGHVLVVPRRHWPTLADVPVRDSADVAVWEELAQVVRVVAKAVVKSGFADGANVLQCNGPAAGQTVGHLHFHVIPRFGGPVTSPAFVSGAGKYADDAERDAVAARLRDAVARVLAEEDLPA